MTSKERFQAGPHKDPHRKWASSEVGEIATETALLTMIDNLPLSMSPSESWDNHSQIVGARKVLSILRELHIPEKQTKPANWARTNLKSPE